MSVLHSPRTPWVMVALFCAAALLLLAAAAGPDLGLMFDTAPEPAPLPVRREVRMPIVIEKSVAPPPAAQSKPTMGERPLLRHAEKSPGLPSAKHSDAPQPATPQPAPLSTGTLLSHDLQWRAGRFEARFQTDRRVTESKIFFRSSPAMWVLDLPGRWQNRARRINNLEQGAVARVVIGEHADFLRVVFHYRARDAQRPAQAPRITELENGFVVVLQ